MQDGLGVLASLPTSQSFSLCFTRTLQSVDCSIRCCMGNFMFVGCVGLLFDLKCPHRRRVAS